MPAAAVNARAARDPSRDFAGEIRGDKRWRHTSDLGGRLFQLVAVEIGAMDDDGLLLASREHQATLRQESKITGVEPAIGLQGQGVGAPGGSSTESVKWPELAIQMID